MHIEDVSLKHTLTDPEMAQLARQQANAIEKKTVTEGDLVAIKKDYGGRIALAQAEIGSISSRVNSGWEMRNVRCILADERLPAYRLTIRTDNGHVAKRRKLNPEERQIKISADQLRQYSASALLQVDDPDWDTEVCQIPFFSDEVEELRAVRPPIQFVPIAPMRQIENTESDDANKPS